ncbi:MAG TPA: RNA-binding protein [Bacteroidia bacterium]|nr:RNA-binding protein [Bacteroidia bacterium]
MENQSQNQAHRPQRGGRSRNRNRNRNNRQSNSSSQSNGGQSSGRSRQRNRRGPRSNKPPRQTTVQKILSILTFGLLGKPKAKSGKAAAKSTGPAKKAAAPAARQTETAAPRKPAKNRAEVTSNRLYVGNLDYSTGEPELEDLFRGVGNVLSAEVVTNPRTQQSKGFAFVEMGSIDEAKRAVSILDDQEFMGRRLIVSGARSEGVGDEADGELVGAPADQQA